MFKIQDVGNKDIEACCWFDYKGYTISMSSIFKPKDICILNKTSIVRNRLNSVQEAIQEIDKLTDITALVNSLTHKLDDGSTILEYLKLQNPKLISDLREVLA